ncbi:type IV pilus modification protein PilV [Thermomonas sp.]|uniref:type IV pilus modification protein PilV n=1 Tax=Thermomonas sp. TaxID=1971895 RepID=UPI00260D6B83|nr:type IV pilus modification protein PilV [Thermomonas sp.]HRO63649.1 type IV pilus modification protein PilV [Thermomonas sp.]
MKMPVSLPRPQRGISMIEVLISVLVLALGLMGMAAMQSLALRGGQSSLESSQAVMASNSIIEAMRANRTNAASYVFDGTASCGTVPAAGLSLASWDIHQWTLQLKTAIGNDPADPGTCGKIEQAGGVYTVTVQWDDRRAGGSQTNQVVTRARL